MPMTDPFLALVTEALNLTHPRFAAAHGLAYTPEEADEPAAARKARSTAARAGGGKRSNAICGSAGAVCWAADAIMIVAKADGPEERNITDRAVTSP